MQTQKLYKFHSAGVVYVGEEPEWLCGVRFFSLDIHNICNSIASVFFPLRIR